MSSASAVISATRPGNAARTTGVVNTSRVAAIIIRMSAAISPAAACSAVGAAGNAASCTSSALLDHRRYNADLVVPARSATAAKLRFEYPICTSSSAVADRIAESMRGSRGRPAPGALSREGRSAFITLPKVA